ncbi:MAG TPA: hypothetical protein VF147_14170 [Vicinamibacterales bacterium]
MRFGIFGFGVECDIPLPELPRSARRADVRVRARNVHPARRRWTSVEENHDIDGRPWLTIGRHGDDWLLRFPRFADFEVRDGGRTILARTRAGVPPNTIRHLLVDSVLPLALSALGHLLLHASGVAGRSGSVLFVGGTGTGKSTLAATFAGPLRPFTDDAVRVTERNGAFIARGAYPGARLWPDAVAVLGSRPAARPVAHYTEKRRIALAAPRAGRTIRVIYVLQAAPAASVTIRRCTRRAALVSVLSHAYRLDPADRDVSRRHLDLVTSLSAAVPVFTLAFPENLERIRDVRDAVADHVTSITAESKAHGR